MPSAGSEIPEENSSDLRCETSELKTETDSSVLMTEIKEEDDQLKNLNEASNQR